MPSGKRAEIAEKRPKMKRTPRVFKRRSGNLVLVPSLRENYSYYYLHEKLQTESAQERQQAELHDRRSALERGLVIGLLLIQFDDRFGEIDVGAIRDFFFE